jgi:hypothetical protein
MPSFREAYEDTRHALELALGLEHARSLDELVASGGRADGAFSMQMQWTPHGEHPGRWAEDNPGRVEGTTIVSWVRRVKPDAQLDADVQIATDHDSLVRALVFGSTGSLAEITFRFRSASPLATTSKEWRRGQGVFEFEHYYDAEAA